MKNAGFGKNHGKCKKHRDFELVTTKTRRNYLVSEPNYHAANIFSEDLLAIAIKKEHKYL